MIGEGSEPPHKSPKRRSRSKPQPRKTATRSAIVRPTAPKASPRPKPRVKPQPRPSKSIVQKVKVIVSPGGPMQAASAGGTHTTTVIDPYLMMRIPATAPHDPPPPRFSDPPPTVHWLQPTKQQTPSPIPFRFATPKSSKAGYQSDFADRAASIISRVKSMTPNQLSDFQKTPSSALVSTDEGSAVRVPIKIFSPPRAAAPSTRQERELRKLANSSGWQGV